MIVAAVLNILFIVPSIFARLFLGRRVYRYITESEKYNITMKCLFCLSFFAGFFLFVFLSVNIGDFFESRTDLQETLIIVSDFVIASAVSVVCYLLIAKFLKKQMGKDAEGAVILADKRYDDLLFYYAMKEYNGRYRDKPEKFDKLYPNGVEQYIDVIRGLMKIRKVSTNEITVAGNAFVYECVFDKKYTEAIDYITDDIKGKEAVEFCKEQIAAKP